LDNYLKATAALFAIGYLGSVIPIADATLFSGSITAMTIACGTANVKPANGSGFCRNRRHVDGSQTERQNGKFEKEFLRVHISRLLSTRKS
jgi:hypothetical protein